MHMVKVGKLFGNQHASYIKQHYTVRITLDDNGIQCDGATQRQVK